MTDAVSFVHASAMADVTVPVVVVLGRLAHDRMRESEGPARSLTLRPPARPSLRVIGREREKGHSLVLQDNRC